MTSSSISLIQYAGLCPDPPLADFLPCLTCPQSLWYATCHITGAHMGIHASSGKLRRWSRTLSRLCYCAAPCVCRTLPLCKVCSTLLFATPVKETGSDLQRGKTVCQPSRCLQAIWLCLSAVSFPFAENTFLFDFLFVPLLFCVPPAWLLDIYPSFPSVAVLQCVYNTFSGLF